LRLAFPLVCPAVELGEPELPLRGKLHVGSCHTPPAEWLSRCCAVLGAVCCGAPIATSAVLNVSAASSDRA
jgi:hypothetical protein